MKKLNCKKVLILLFIRLTPVNLNASIIENRDFNQCIQFSSLLLEDIVSVYKSLFYK